MPNQKGSINPPDQKIAASAGKATDVVILGTIHFPWNKRFQAADIERILVALAPDAILMEMSPYFSEGDTRRTIPTITKTGKLSKQYAKFVMDPSQKNYSQEFPAIDGASRTLGIRIHPIDLENMNLYLSQYRPISRSRKVAEFLPKLTDHLESRKDSRAVANKIALQSLFRIHNNTDHVMRCATPDVLNSGGYDDLRRLSADLFDNLVPAICAQYRSFVDKHYPSYDQFVEDHATFVRFWHGREKIMAENIERIALKYPGKRLAVVAGGSHRCGLRDRLVDQKHIQLREFWEILTEDQWRRA